MIEGRIDHQGSLEHGQVLAANDVQVQRAGGEGFSHNEVNPDDSTNRMIQLWVLPEQKGEPTAYKLYKLPLGEVTRVYGGSNDQSDTFPGHTVIEVALFDPSGELVIDKPFLAYLAVGEATANSIDIEEGALYKGDQLSFHGKSNGKLIVIYEIWLGAPAGGNFAPFHRRQ